MSKHKPIWKTRPLGGVQDLRSGLQVMFPGIDHPEDHIVIYYWTAGRNDEININDKRGDEYTVKLSEILVVEDINAKE